MQKIIIFWYEAISLPKIYRKSHHLHLKTLCRGGFCFQTVNCFPGIFGSGNTVPPSSSFRLLVRVSCEAGHGVLMGTEGRAPHRVQRQAAQLLSPRKTPAEAQACTLAASSEIPARPSRPTSQSLLWAPTFGRNPSGQRAQWETCH